VAEPLAPFVAVSLIIFGVQALFAHLFATLMALALTAMRFMLVKSVFGHNNSQG
jgi:hypothetical protein